MIHRLLLAFFCLVAIGRAAETPAPIDPSLPKILLIGDSISGGYEKAVKQALTGKAYVEKNAGNAEWTGNGLNKIDQWLGEAKWDIIHFNFGLWDMYGWAYYDQDRSPEAYARRLEQLVTRMEQTGAKLIWATTTPACSDPEKTMLSRFKKSVVITPEQQAAYQNAALGVMKKHHVDINDLYNFMLPNMEKFGQGADNVHFNEAGNGALAKKVATVLEQALADLKKK